MVYIETRITVIAIAFVIAIAATPNNNDVLFYSCCQS